MATVRKERFVRSRKLTPQMKACILEKMMYEQWSPGQIKGHADINGIPMVSYKTIYKLIRIDKANGGDFYKNCRHRLKHQTRPVGGKVLTIKDKRSIDERPSVVDERSRIGDWEIDSIVGPSNKISEKLDASFYFAHPYSSWERGCNENTNGLVRQYIPKKQDFDDISELEVKEIQMKINRRPRKNSDTLRRPRFFTVPCRKVLHW